jgi:putative sigma-54 modulation protein
MKINIKATGIELTVPLREYVEEKIGSITKFLSRWDAEGAAEAWVEVGRSTNHHHKGDVFRAEVDIRVPGKVLRAEDADSDVRVALDCVRDKLKREAEKYKATHEASQGRSSEGEI